MEAEAGRKICEFEARLVYTGGPRAVRITVRFCLKNNTEQIKTK